MRMEGGSAGEETGRAERGGADTAASAQRSLPSHHLHGRQGRQDGAVPIMVVLKSRTYWLDFLFFLNQSANKEDPLRDHQGSIPTLRPLRCWCWHFHIPAASLQA